MARIRTVKPSFASDGKNVKLTDSCALFFILLWNHCDDEGKIENDPETIANLVCRWHKGKVKNFINSLTTNGQLRINSTSTWLQVVNWSHQRINKPIQPKVKASDLQWVTQIDSVNGHTSSSSDEPNGKDRIRIGEERIVSTVDEEKKIAAKKICDELRQRPIWIEGVAMKRKISPDQVLKRIDDFELHIFTVNKIPVSSEAQGHFDNWLRIQLSQPPQRIDNKKPITPAKSTGKLQF